MTRITWVALGAVVAANCLACRADDGPAIERFRGADGEWSFYLPARLQVADDTAGGFRLTRYSLVHEADTRTPGLGQGAVHQGGFLTYRIRAAAPSQTLKPVALRWKAVHWSAGIASGVLNFPGEAASPDASVAVTLLREDVDILRPPDGSIVVARPLTTTLHLIAVDFVELDPKLVGAPVVASPAAVRAAVGNWRQAHAEATPGVFDLAGRSATGDGSCAVALSESRPFVRACLADGTVAVKAAGPVAYDDATLDAVFTLLRVRYFDYRMARVASVTDAVPAAVWREVKAPAPLVVTLNRWTEVERPVRRGVDAGPATWSDKTLVIDGFERETRQRLHLYLDDRLQRSGVKSVTVELEVTDPVTKVTARAVAAVPVTGTSEPVIKELKARYSPQLEARWRFVAAQKADGTILKRPRELAWERQIIPNFDAVIALHLREWPELVGGPADDANAEKP